MMEQNNCSDPLKSPVIQEIIMSNRIGHISEEIAKQLGVAPTEALKMFYASQTCADLHDLSSRLYLYGDLYIVDEYIRETQLNQK